MIFATVLRLGSLVGVVLILAGCASSQLHMSRAALDAHLAQEMAVNQMLLLNLIRANLGYPLHFSRIDSMSVVAGDATPAVGLSLGFLSADSNPTRTLTIGATGTRPTLEVTPLDSKEFVQGLTTPLGVDWMVYFVNQGWEMKLVVDLLIERVERVKSLTLSADKDPEPTYTADPEALEALAKCSEIELEPAAGKPYGPKVSGADLIGKVSIVEARKAGLSIKDVSDEAGGGKGTDGRFQLLEPPSVVAVKFRCGGQESQTVQANSPASVLRARSAESNLPPPRLGSVGDRRIVMRSPARVIRHLGSMARVRGSADAATGGGVQWRIGEPPGEADAAVRVAYGGKTYWIATSDAETMKTLALVNHVLLLKGSTNEAPSTETVRVRVIPR